MKQLVTAKKEMEEATTALAAIKDAVRLLESQPLNPQANAAYGRFLCFVKGDWDFGITMLAPGNEELLKSPAAKELRAGSDPVAQLAAADAWWELALKQAGAVRRRVRQHAAAPAIACAAGAGRGRQAAGGPAVERGGGGRGRGRSAGHSEKPQRHKGVGGHGPRRSLARKARAAKSLVAGVEQRAPLRSGEARPAQDSGWTITPAGLQLKGANANSIESLFTISGDCELSLTVSGHCTDPPAIQLFGEEITPPRPATVVTYEQPYVWQVNIMRRGPLLTAAIGPRRIATLTIKEAQQGVPTDLGLKYTRTDFGMMLLNVTIRPEFSTGQ